MNNFIGVGAQSTLGGTTFLPKKYASKVNKMPEFYVILAQKLSKYPNFYICPKNKIPEFYMNFARKRPKFYIIITPKIFSPIFFGGGTCPHWPPPLLLSPPVSYAYEQFWAFSGDRLYLVIKSSDEADWLRSPPLSRGEGRASLDISPCSLALRQQIRF